MPPPAPRALSENAGIFFRGERLPAAARLTPGAADRLLAARNPNGRPNADVVRRSATWTRGRLREHWLVDFPPDMDAQEAALYIAPSKLAGRASGLDRDLRNALARRERYLAMPVDGTPARFAWLDSAVLPDDSLLVAARDDDFAHGVLTSAFFAGWWREYHAPREPLHAFASFPWPWPPATLLGRLTRRQEEHRLAIAQAARTGDQERVDAAVAAAYGWPAGLAAEDLLAHLGDLHRTRST